MVLEVAILDVRPGEGELFEAAFGEASPIIAGAGGYIAHELRRCVEDANRYMLLVQWETLEDHMRGFRESAAFGEWRRLLHHFYVQPPLMQHYAQVFPHS